MKRFSEVASIFGISEVSIRRWIKVGRLKAVRLPNGDLRIPDEEINRLTNGGGQR
jgi:excisionase family DNA binding protein